MVLTSELACLQDCVGVDMTLALFRHSEEEHPEVDIRSGRVWGTAENEMDADISDRHKNKTGVWSYSYIFTFKFWWSFRDLE